MRGDLLQRTIKFLKNISIGFFSKFSSERPIFIVGCGHSGTTLMLRILSNHPELYSIKYESKVFLGNYIKFSKILKWKKVISTSEYTRWVEKTPKHITALDKMFKVFPNAKVIMMLRDGRDVTVSIRKRYNDSNLAMTRWLKDNRLGLKYKEDPRVIIVKLEDLTMNTQHTLEKICKHLELEFDNRLLQNDSEEFSFHSSKPEFTENRSGSDHLKNRVWQVNQKIFNPSKWKSEATVEEKEMFKTSKEFIELMRELGYY